MSIRALGRQWVAQWRNPQRYLPGTENFPQGRLFFPGQTAGYKPGPDVVEAARRRQTGQANPEAPWRPRWFLSQFPPVNQRTGRVDKPPQQGSLL